jgi:hypothetical protein
MSPIGGRIKVIDWRGIILTGQTIAQIVQVRNRPDSAFVPCSMTRERLTGVISEGSVNRERTIIDSPIKK